MDRWAVKYGDDATFVCVGCAGPELAETFGSRLRLKHCVNSYVSRNNMPRWGQLGCNGFIVLDGSHSVELEPRQHRDASRGSSLTPVQNPRERAALRPGFA